MSLFFLSQYWNTRRRINYVYMNWTKYLNSFFFFLNAGCCSSCPALCQIRRRNLRVMISLKNTLGMHSYLYYKLYLYTVFLKSKLFYLLLFFSENFNPESFLLLLYVSREFALETVWRVLTSWILAFSKQQLLLIRKLSKKRRSGPELFSFWSEKGISVYLQRVWHEIFDFRFFSWISLPPDSWVSH